MTVDENSRGLAVVVNPHTLQGPCAALWATALARLRSGRPVTRLDTAGDGGDAARIAACIAAERPSIVVAAGGDGTVRDVAAALVAGGPSPAPALAILPLGTANNIARSLGLLAFRQRGPEAVERAVVAILAGTERRIDLGQADAHLFCGSFAVGMDAAILSARNRWRRRWHLGPRLGGYPLYLFSCAVSLARQRSVAGRLQIDGAPHDGPVYNLLVLNTALYAGEFRFDGADHSADGRLDLHLFTSPSDYVRAFVTAWRRHLRHQRGASIAPPAGLRRIEHAAIALAQPMAAQIDGEEHGSADRYDVRVLPGALRVRVP